MAQLATINPILIQSNSLNGVDLLKPWVFQETQACDAKIGVEYVYHVPRPIRQTAQVRILGENTVRPVH